MREDAVFGLRNRKGRRGERFRRLSSLDESTLGEDESTTLANDLKGDE